MRNRRVTLRDRDNLFVDAELKANGDLVISGQALSGGEYEYALTVKQPAVARVVAALSPSSAQGQTDVLDLLVSHAEEVVGTGERTWLKSHGIEAEFWSRVDMDFE